LKKPFGTAGRLFLLLQPQLQNTTAKLPAACSPLPPAYDTDFSRYRNRVACASIGDGDVPTQ
jgi:hypothetical protein